MNHNTYSYLYYILKLKCIYVTFFFSWISLIQINFIDSYNLLHHIDLNFNQTMYVIIFADGKLIRHFIEFSQSHLINKIILDVRQDDIYLVLSLFNDKSVIPTPYLPRRTLVHASRHCLLLFQSISWLTEHTLYIGGGRGSFVHDISY